MILCREVRDAERLRPELGGVQVVFWPGAVAWDSTRPVHPDDDFARDTARDCARTLGSHLVQCNWPQWLNDPGVTGLGGSLVVSPGGDLLHQCPLDEAGISIVTIEPS